MKKKKIYISGKIGSEELTDEVREKFARAERMLREKGWRVFNPTTSGLGAEAEMNMRMNQEVAMPTSWYQEILLLDIEELSKCDAIYMLPDYKYSPGARTELGFADAVGKQILFADKMQAYEFASMRCFDRAKSKNRWYDGRKYPLFGVLRERYLSLYWKRFYLAMD